MNSYEEVLREIERLEARKQYGPALDAAQAGLRKFPRTRPLAKKLAVLLEKVQNYPQALALFRQLQEETQQSGGKSELDVVLGIGRCLVRTQQYDQAISLYEQLLPSVPDQPDALTGLAICLRHKGQLANAEDRVNHALASRNDFMPAIHELAEVHIANKEPDRAIPLLEKNIRRPEIYGDSIDLWLSTLEKLKRNRYAQDTLEELVKQYPNTVEFVYGFAVLANRAGEASLARPAYLKALELSPGNARILYELGVLERTAGRLERSQELMGQALQIKPDNPAALRTYGADRKYEYGDANFKRLNYVAARFTEFAPLEQIHLHYALAKAFEDVGELDTAFRHYGTAGEKKRKLETWNERNAAKLIQMIPRVVTPENIGKSGQTGCTSDVPVFILGMPRSGTSLMEQILSSHPDIFGAGELKFLTGILENIDLAGMRVRMGEEDPVFAYDMNASWEMRGQRYVDKLVKLAGRGYKRIVDKMPGNYNFVGLIHAILPNAKIIHSRRDPIETCLSCYRIHFAEGHQWTYNLRELGRFYKRYWGLMQYWREKFPGVMYEVNYEDNVADVEGQARRLIDYLGLEWNDNCLEFYNTDRPVKTASVTQVRKPIYTTSTNRWRKYEKYLGPLLEELGDIPAQYEKMLAK
jgi:tetratricopeptide (TPR) repeat protein